MQEQNIICRKTLICGQLFAGQVVGSQSMKRKKKTLNDNDYYFYHANFHYCNSYYTIPWWATSGDLIFSSKTLAHTSSGIVSPRSKISWTLPPSSVCNSIAWLIISEPERGKERHKTVNIFYHKCSIFWWNFALDKRTVTCSLASPIFSLMISLRRNLEWKGSNEQITVVISY